VILAIFYRDMGAGISDEVTLEQKHEPEEEVSHE
jgi:hypothetical protein